MKRIEPNPISTASHKIVLRYDGTNLSSGTAFFYNHGGSHWLVTNWHNLAGRNPYTGVPLSKTAAIPNELVLKAAMWGNDGSRDYLYWHESVISLFDEDATPKWKIHPEHREKIDVAAMEFRAIPEGLRVVNDDKKLDLTKFKIRAGMDLFVIGYPLGISGGASFPVWKRASIASEPSVDVDGVPKIIIDTATREGMSGSPVFARNTGYWAPEGKTRMEDHVFGEGTTFLGVYSGRIIGEDILAAQLGIVWKESALVEIVESSCYDVAR